MAVSDSLADKVHDFILSGAPQKAARPVDRHPLWQQLRTLGTELWLDTGSIPDAERLWTAEFSALTTNNTLLNKEIQTGQYDELVRQAGRFLADFGLPERERLLEIAFILNARHGLRLVAEFGAYVSVEEHTDLAHDPDRAVAYARRYHAICPERFVVKIPFTAEGLLATRRLAADGVAVNHTLGFSARQNYVIARLGKPAFVNVFLGRLNSFVADHGLGSGEFVGEKAAVASQAAVRELREAGRSPSRQIGASLRNGGQVRTLAGLDVLTIPPKAAEEFVKRHGADTSIGDVTSRLSEPEFHDAAQAAQARFGVLWEVDDALRRAVDVLEREDLDRFSGTDLMDFFSSHGCPDFLVPWTADEIAASAREGKIPQWDRWREAVATRRAGLDALMNLAGLNAFRTDQEDMDRHVAAALGG